MQFLSLQWSSLIYYCGGVATGSYALVVPYDYFMALNWKFIFHRHVSMEYKFPI